MKQLRAAFAGSARGSKNAKLSGGLVAIEGEHLLFEAMRSGMAFKTIFVSASRSVPKWMPRSVELIELTDEVFASVVDTQSPQGIAALLVPPVWTLENGLTERATREAGADAEIEGTRTPLVLIAAGLQDPGNLGTLVRSAEAFGVTAVLTTPGTVSEWNQKAMRASAGSVFRVPVVQVGAAEIAGLKGRGMRIYAAVADDPLQRRALPLGEAELAGPCAVMIGNEGAGLSEELLALADARITIPTPGRIESLNAAVAGSLVLYEASRQRS